MNTAAAALYGITDTLNSLHSECHASCTTRLALTERSSSIDPKVKSVLGQDLTELLCHEFTSKNLMKTICKLMSDQDERFERILGIVLL